MPESSAFNGAVCDLVTFGIDYLKLKVFLLALVIQSRPCCSMEVTERKHFFLYCSLFSCFVLFFFGLFLEVVVRSFLFAMVMREVLCNVYKKTFYIYKAVVHTRDGLLPLKSSIENLHISLMRFLFIIIRNVVVDILE